LSVNHADIDPVLTTGKTHLIICNEASFQLFESGPENGHNWLFISHNSRRLAKLHRKTYFNIDIIAYK